MSTMITLAKVRTPFLVSTMSIYRWKELNVVEGSTCVIFVLWKLTFHTMAAKVLQITSWVLVHSLPWTQCKRCIPIGSMGCAHTHVEWYLQLRDGVIQIAYKMLWKKLGKIIERLGRFIVISQVPILGPKHHKIWARWASNVLLKSMLERVWWCRHFKMESWSWTIYCLMTCSNGNRHAHDEGGRRSHGALKCCWKGNELLSIRVKVSKRKGRWSTINLTTMIKATRAQFIK